MGTDPAYAYEGGCLCGAVRFASRCHIWSRSRIRWFETADALPRYDDAGPPPPVG